jgi:hypothetical protein
MMLSGNSWIAAALAIIAAAMAIGGKLSIHHTKAFANNSANARRAIFFREALNWLQNHTMEQKENPMGYLPIW